jgi:hypothetical protein
MKKAAAIPGHVREPDSGQDLARLKNKNVPFCL